jgi:hypothetical protein
MGQQLVIRGNQFAMNHSSPKEIWGLIELQIDIKQDFIKNMLAQPINVLGLARVQHAHFVAQVFVQSPLHHQQQCVNEWRRNLMRIFIGTFAISSIAHQSCGLVSLTIG